MWIKEYFVQKVTDSSYKSSDEDVEYLLKKNFLVITPEFYETIIYRSGTITIINKHLLAKVRKAIYNISNSLPLKFSLWQNITMDTITIFEGK